MPFYKNKKIMIITAIIAAVLILGGIFTFKLAKEKQALNENVDAMVETYTIPEGEKIFINGVIVPKETKDFFPSQDEEVTSIAVKNGQSVKKGDVLFSSKNSTVSSELTALKAQLDALKAQKNAAVTDEEKKSFDSEITKLNSQISETSKKASPSTLAPFSGKVFLNENNQNSEQASAFMTIQSEEFYMKGQASEQDLSKLSIDQTVDVMIFSNEKRLTGRVSFISQRPSTDAEGQQQNALSYYDINISFDSQEELVNGFHVQASFQSTESSYKIPSSCILKDGDKSYVFKDLDGTLKKQNVDVASKNEDFAVVRGGLEENDNIIKFPTKEMKEGDPVTPPEASK